MKPKGFTLIELLVVVAIIGILAAVGIVAYSGYTSSAKKNSYISRHDIIVKFFKAEFLKCEIGEKVYLANEATDQCEKILDPSKRNLRLLRNTLIDHINIVMEYKQDNGGDAARSKYIGAPLCNYLGEICLKRDIANERIVIVSNIDNDPNNYLTSYLELDY